MCCQFNLCLPQTEVVPLAAILAEPVALTLAISHTPRQLSHLLTDNSGSNSSLAFCKMTGFVMKVLNGRSLQSEWERVVNGLHKALFIQPAPVPVCRRDVATGVCVCV